MRHHAFELAVVHYPQNARRERHRRVLRVAARGECVGRIVVDQPQFRHGQPHAPRQVRYDRLDAAVHFRILLGRYRLSRVAGQCNLVGKEVSDEIHHDSQRQSDIDAVPAADRLSAENEQPAQQAQKQDGFHCVAAMHIK